MATRAIEACFRGHRTAVFVCRCMANLYSSPRSSTRVAPAAPCAEWALAYTGVPVLLLDGGNTKSRLKRQIQVGLLSVSAGMLGDIPIDSVPRL